jgi:hypothetical protein
MKRFHILLLLIFFLSIQLKAQNDKKKPLVDTLKDRPKKGWNFGVIPYIGYSTDRGFQYGGLINIFNYGDSRIYPKYYQNIYMEVSRTTKGSGINQLFFDSEHLIKGLRVTADISHLTEQALNFYGFNGAHSRYNSNFIEDGNPDYISRVFYDYQRKLTRALVYLQGNVGIPGIKWLGGAQITNIIINSVDINDLNKDLTGSKKLPNVDGLYDDYVKWGLIDNKDKNGGTVSFFSLGAIYDTRDNESNPNHGVWDEAIVADAPGAVNPDNGFSEIALTHRQYFTLSPDRLTLAYRVNWQQTLSGKVPFYFLPYKINSIPFSTFIDGLGGSNTIRGILRNRVVADGKMLGNIELRYKAYQTYWHRQNIYIGLSSFYDAGFITKKTAVDLSMVPTADRLKYFDENAANRLYQSIGLGLHFVMNQNFIISPEYGIALNKNDGSSALYISVGYIF